MKVIPCRPAGSRSAAFDDRARLGCHHSLIVYDSTLAYAAAKAALTARSHRFDAEKRLRSVDATQAHLRACAMEKAARCSKLDLMNQVRLDRRDPRLGFTQRLGACMHGMGTQ